MAKPFTLRELSRDDLVRLDEPRHDVGLPMRLRESHHQVARLFASGLRSGEVVKRTGYSYTRLNTLLKSPAFQQLIAEKRSVVDEAWAASQDEYQELLFANAIGAERHISDHIAEADEKDELIPIKSALAISRDAADRLGYGKKQTNVNVNIDFAAKLESMIRRSGKTIEARPPSVLPERSRAPVVESPPATPQEPLRRRA